MKILSYLKSIVSVTCLATTLSAAVIIDTGPGGTDFGPALGKVGPFYNQALAAQFNLTSQKQITEVSGWMVNTLFPGNLNISIRTDFDSHPGATLFQSSIQIGSFFTPAWKGISMVEWNLGPGTYWAVFSSPDLVAYMPWLTSDANATPAFKPLNYAATDTNAATPLWLLFPDLETNDAFGVQILGDNVGTLSPVPEPATYGLFASLGLAGLALFRRARSRKLI